MSLIGKAGCSGANHCYLSHALDLGPAEIYQLHANSFEASFLEPDELEGFQKHLAECFHGFMGIPPPAKA